MRRPGGLRSVWFPFAFFCATAAPSASAQVAWPTPPQSLSDSDAGPRCDRDRKEADAVRALLDDVERGRAGVRTVDEFLGKLPESVRSSFLFVAESKSVQQASVAAPRVLLKSPNSEVAVSFNTSAEHAGYDAVELQVWNARTERLELSEVRFPADSKDPALRSWSGPRVEREPAKCAVCHQGSGGNPALAHLSSKPVIDPYRFWAGFVPFSEDRLSRGSVEVKWFKSYLDRVHGGAPRYRRLATQLTSVALDRALGASAGVQVPSARAWSSQPVNTPGLDLSHQFLVINGCRIAGELKRRSGGREWDTLKRLVAGGFRCSDPTIFLDDEGNRRAREWFKARGLGLRGGEFSFDALVAETREAQHRVAEEREGRQFWFLERELGSASEAEREIALADRNNIRGKDRRGPSKIGDDDNQHLVSKSRFPTFETDYREAARLRYLLEPLGIETNRWSMAVDPETYSHVEFFPELFRDDEIRGVMQEEGCDRMAEKTRTRVGTLSRTSSAAPGGLLKAELRQRARSPGVAPASMPSALSSCAGCHSSGINGAPPIPFSNPRALESLISKTAGKLGDVGERIWDRVTRRQDQYGAMPVGFALGDDDKIAIRAWLDRLGSGSPGSRRLTAQGTVRSKTPARGVASDAPAPRKR